MNKDFKYKNDLNSQLGEQMWRLKGKAAKVLYNSTYEKYKTAPKLYYRRRTNTP